MSIDFFSHLRTADGRKAWTIGYWEGDKNTRAVLVSNADGTALVYEYDSEGRIPGGQHPELDLHNE